jgi:hypothetical protein
MCRRIKLMWDYGCWPIWENDGQIFDNVDPATLPLSKPTFMRLQAWSAIPDTKLEEVEDPQDMQWTAEEQQAFEAEGHALLRLLERELGSDYDVVYEGEGSEM